MEEGKQEKKLRKEVLTLLQRGQVGRARRRVVSNGVASMDDPRVQSAMKEKYPPRSHPMPDSVHSGTCMASLPGLRETLLGLEPGVSAGFGGLRNEHLVCAAKEWSDGEVALLESFSLRYLNGELPPWWYRVWGSVSTIPLFKTLEQDTSKVRPLGIKCSLPRVLHKRVVQANRGALCDFLEPEQLALSPAGSPK